MASYTIATTLYAGVQGQVEFPEDKTWDDVEDWYVKWDTLNVKFKDDADWISLELNSDSMDAIDWKRPKSVTVYPRNEDGTDYGTEVASTGD